MVLFGAPKAVEDSPRRAVQTALEMRDCIHEARQARSVDAELDIHIGINTGRWARSRSGSTP
jgi:class 3 adenylate cyclase